jgi:hypothetical protein
MQHGIFQNPLSFRSHYATAVTSSDPFVNSYHPSSQANDPPYAEQGNDT